MFDKSRIDIGDEVSIKISSDKYMKEALIIMKEFCNKKLSNEKSFLERINPRPEMKLYYVNDKYFFTETGLETYCEKNNISIYNTNVMEYYRRFAGQNDVLKINGKCYTQLYENIIAVYNAGRSSKGMPIWEYRLGCLAFEYQLLKNVGIVLENDIHGQNDNKNERTLKNAIGKQ